MQKNPYKYTGLLDPLEDMSVCVFREKDLNKVIEGILQGAFWAILGPRQIGKTTFLCQIKYKLANYHCIYIDFVVTSKNEAEFYNRIVNTIYEQVGGKPQANILERGDVLGYDVLFYDFLRTLTSTTDKKIILLLDEIENIPFMKSFLKIWRKVYNERFQRTELKKVTLVTAGAAELIPLTIGEKSPFNIASKLYLDNLTADESLRLIVEPMRKLGIKLQDEAVEEIFEQTSGHPQMLQHILHILVELFLGKKIVISVQEVNYAIKKLFRESDNLKTLEHQIKTDKTLKNLVRRILKREKIDYSTYDHFSITGIGPIVSENDYCAIRNKIYTDFIKRKIDIEIDPPPTKKTKFKTTIYFRMKHPGFDSDEKEENFLKELFECDEIKIEIEKIGNTKEIKKLLLKGNTKSIFCYLAYKNYKAIRKDKFPNWEKIPISYKYRLSGVIENNEDQKPEWQIFYKLLNSEREVKIGDQDIRQWKKKLIDNLKIGDIIHRSSGKIKGYLLKGTVDFLIKKSL
ncbi:AAA-like domain-containing protein [Acidobacteriota bacterium]